jgi:SAM-dependent methyltransferase
LIPERLVPGTLEWDLFRYEHEQRYQFFLDGYRGRDVLDAACGVGYGSAIIAGAGARSVTGVDIDPGAVEYAAKHFGGPATEFRTLGVEDLAQLGKTFDLVVSFETLEHLKDPAGFIRTVRSVLRPGGRFVCSTPNRDFAGRPPGYVNPYHLNELGLEEFAEAFGNSFAIDGRYHQSHSESYRRHLQMLGEFDRVAKAVRFSKFLRAENFLRRVLGRGRWAVGAPADNLARAVPGDFVIEPVSRPAPAHLTYIFEGTAKV